MRARNEVVRNQPLTAHSAFSTPPAGLRASSLVQHEGAFAECARGYELRLEPDMKRWEHRSFNVVAAVVTGTGLGYLSMKYFMHTDDPFAIVNHPWQPTALSLHVVSAPFLILFFGMIFRSHTLRKLQSPIPSNRRTGWTSLVSFAGMAMSGYLLQVLTDAAWLHAMVVAHVAASVLFVGGYLGHLLIGWRMAWDGSRAAGQTRLAEGPSSSS